MADKDSEGERETQATMLALLNTLNDNVNKVMNQNKKFEERINSLENNHSTPPSPKASETHEDARDNLFEDSDKEDTDDDSELDLTFQDTIFQKKVGENIREPLANAIQMSLLGVDDTKKLVNIHEQNHRPGNVAGLIVPELNKEIVSTDKTPAITAKENQLCGIQRNVCTAISIMTNILNDVGKSKNRTLMREDIFHKTNDAISVLAAAHKGLNLARKMNVKPVLSHNIQYLCTKAYSVEEDRSTNSLLFDEDLGNECDKAIRHTHRQKDSPSYHPQFFSQMN